MTAGRELREEVSQPSSQLKRRRSGKKKEAIKPSASSNLPECCFARSLRLCSVLSNETPSLVLEILSKLSITLFNKNKV